MKPGARSLAHTTCLNCGIVAPESWTPDSVAVLNHLNTRKTIRKIGKGSFLFHEGDPVTALFRLLHGVILLRKGDHEGNSIVTRMVTPSATLGFRAFMANERHSVTAQCATDITVCCIPAEAAEAAFTTNRSLERVFAQHVAQEIEYAENVIIAHMKLTVYDRLILIFDQLATEFGSEAEGDSWIVPVPVLRSDLASMAGIARESFSRCLARIEAEQIILYVGKVIHIPSMRHFRSVVEAVRRRHSALSPPA